jgi:hypothetical protein
MNAIADAASNACPSRFWPVPPSGLNRPAQIERLSS